MQKEMGMYFAGQHTILFCSLPSKQMCGEGTGRLLIERILWVLPRLHRQSKGGLTENK